MNEEERQDWRTGVEWEEKSLALLSMDILDLRRFPYVIFFQVNANGVLSFRTPFGSSCPEPFPLSSDVLIAAFWANFDVEEGGQFHFQLTNDEILLSAVGSFIHARVYCDYSPGLLVIATIDSVPQFQSSVSMK